MKSEVNRSSYRVFRGGSWFGVTWNVRDAHRYWFAPGYRNFVLGFRLVRTVRTDRQVNKWREELEEGLFNEK